MNLLVVVQARANSTRLPRKIFQQLSPGKSMLEHVLERAERLGPVFLATPPPDLDENDVLGRYWKVAQLFPEYDTFVRITADCPLLDVGFSQQVIDTYARGHRDLLYRDPPVEPTHYVGTDYALDGLDTEVFSRINLHAAQAFTDKYGPPGDREHVTVGMRQQKGAKIIGIPGLTTRWSVDDQEGLDFVRAVYATCPRCRDAVPHHTNAQNSIGGSVGRAPVWDLHVSEGGGLEECTAADLLMERTGGEVYRSQ